VEPCKRKDTFSSFAEWKTVRKIPRRLSMRLGEESQKGLMFFWKKDFLKKLPSDFKRKVTMFCGAKALISETHKWCIGSKTDIWELPSIAKMGTQRVFE
jgi:hypothetical protein